MPDTATLFLIFLALVFDYLNGFHDAANSIATIVGTRVLTPNKAVIWAAFFNFVAFLIFGTHVAETIGSGIIATEIVDRTVIAAVLLAASIWDLATWYWGLPTSSSHALIGGLLGAALAKVGSIGVVWAGIWKTLAFMVIAPFVGLFIGVAVAIAVYWTFRRSSPSRVDHLFRRGQFISAAAYSLGHGGNDAQKTMGVIFVLLLSLNYILPEPIQGMKVTAAPAGIQVASVEGGSLAEVAHAMKGDVVVKVNSKEVKTYADCWTGLRATKADKIVKVTVLRAGREVELAGKKKITIPLWIVLACHLAMGLGTLGGGWRIVKTMGMKLTPLRPVDGFCAEFGAAVTLFGTGQLGIPVSTTQTITGSIVGVGALKRMSAVRWGIAGRVIWAWLLTIPASALLAILGYVLIHSFVS